MLISCAPTDIKETPITTIDLKTIQTIDATVADINNTIDQFTVIKYDKSVPDRGLAITIYTKDNRKKITTELTGEIKTVISEYYLMNDRVIFAHEYMSDPVNNNAALEDSNYYFADNALISWTKDGKSMAIDATTGDNMLKKIGYYTKS